MGRGVRAGESQGQILACLLTPHQCPGTDGRCTACRTAKALLVTRVPIQPEVRKAWLREGGPRSAGAGGGGQVGCPHLEAVGLTSKGLTAEAGLGRRRTRSLPGPSSLW